MSTNIPQTQEQALATKERFRFRLILAFIILVAFIVSMVLGWLGIIKPSAATLDNGGFCIASTYDSDPEIQGKAGAKNCGVAELPEIPAPAPAVIAQPCFVGGSLVTRTITTKWLLPEGSSLTDANLEVVKLVGSDVMPLPATVSVTSTKTATGYTTVLSGADVLPVSTATKYAFRLTDGGRSSAWASIEAYAAPLGNGSTCSWKSSL
ncbi:hypothetical protein AB0E56_03190 [Microbacterium sp. NPDC028030]|uniref:hypothetical protein n=1 Tax=Microbacterium sp. NPDC028030 TaxID=3155124 RepID=UPI0033FC112F